MSRRSKSHTTATSCDEIAMFQLGHKMIKFNEMRKYFLLNDLKLDILDNKLIHRIKSKKKRLKKELN